MCRRTEKEVKKERIKIMREAGFEPAKALSHMVSNAPESGKTNLTSLEPCPFGHSGTPATKTKEKNN
ncbi:hypothetical protein DRJ25_04250 [Candidatus Woesearchaeota archaeon]|nr:MAG: hypothetical protein DRJ25_04250 [Candidatus Woesearchaeota archaeon]